MAATPPAGNVPAAARWTVVIRSAVVDGDTDPVPVCAKHYTYARESIAPLRMMRADGRWTLDERVGRWLWTLDAQRQSYI